jgi:hypothetical protein
METMIFKDPEIFPTNKLVEDVLGDSYQAYVELIDAVTGPDLGLVPEWRYYNDGKAWLCKVCYKKKTIFWLSVWDKYFKTAFYFTDRNSKDISELEIDIKIKEAFSNAPHYGKLVPLVFNMQNSGQIEDMIKVVRYKKSLK